MESSIDGVVDWHRVKTCNFFPLIMTLQMAALWPGQRELSRRAGRAEQCRQGSSSWADPAVQPLPVALGESRCAMVGQAYEC